MAGLWDAFLVALHYNNTQCAQIVINMLPKHPEFLECDKILPLLKAADEPYIQMIANHFLEPGLSHHKNFMMACQRGHLEVVKFCMAYGYERDRFELLGSLTMAAEYCHLEVLDYLWNHSAYQQESTKRFRTYLLHDIMCGRLHFQDTRNSSVTWRDIIEVVYNQDIISGILKDSPQSWERAPEEMKDKHELETARSEHSQILTAIKTIPCQKRLTRKI